jgi:hypothetical protein
MLTGNQGNDDHLFQAFQQLVRHPVQGHSLCLVDHGVADLVIGDPVQATRCQEFSSRVAKRTWYSRQPK